MFTMRLDEGGKSLFSYVGAHGELEGNLLIFHDVYETLFNLKLFGLYKLSTFICMYVFCYQYFMINC